MLGDTLRGGGSNFRRENILKPRSNPLIPRPPVSPAQRIEGTAAAVQRDPGARAPDPVTSPNTYNPPGGEGGP